MPILIFSIVCLVFALALFIKLVFIDTLETDRIEKKETELRVADLELELKKKQLAVQEANNKLLVARLLHKKFEKTDSQRCEEAKPVN
jgi:competence protein ComGF